MAGRPWRVYGVSVRGTSHLATDTPCQDANRYRVLPDGTLIIAIADGAGSASHSRDGAALAVDQVIESLTRRLDGGRPDDDERGWESLFLETLAEARASLVSYAAGNEIPLRSLATTLSCAVATESMVRVAQ